MSGKILSGEALTLVARWTRKVSGLKAAKTRIPASETTSRATTTIATVLTIDLSVRVAG